MESVILKTLSLCLVFILYDIWWLKMGVKDHQQAPPHLALCSPLSKVLRTKIGHLLDMISAYKLFQASPEPVNFGVSTTLSWVIK